MFIKNFSTPLDNILSISSCIFSLLVFISIISFLRYPTLYKYSSFVSSGCLYLIAIRENVLEEIREFLKHKGYSLEIVIERKAGREYLYLLKVAQCVNQ